MSSSSTGASKGKTATPTALARVKSGVAKNLDERIACTVRNSGLSAEVGGGGNEHN